MEWLQVLTISGSTIGACWYFKRDSDAKLEKIDAKLEKFSDKFTEEMRDYHGRLCKLEERYLQIIQRNMEERKK